MAVVVIKFKDDMRDTPKAVPSFSYSTTDHDGIFGRIMRHTGDAALAIEVDGWAELAEAGEVYEDDVLIAQIVE